jgi:hypothetical protein
MQMNEKATGDALYPIHYIDDFHARWVQDGVAWLGGPGQRALFLITCSLAVGVFALAGMVRAFVKKERRALALLALVPVGYYAFRGAVLLNFSPLARFFMVQVALALFYVDDGFTWLCARLPAPGRKAAAAATGALALGTTIWLGDVTAFKTGSLADILRPISPLSTIPIDQMALARFLKAHVAPGELAILDEAPQYKDINVGFFTGLPEERLARRRWENFEKQLREHPVAPWLFLARGGTLQAKEALEPGADSFTWRGGAWQKAFSPSPDLFVYKRQ